MYLEPVDFNAFLAKMGQQVIWRKANLCPNRDPDSGMPVHTCRACTNGYIWNAPITALLALTGQKIQRDWQRAGQYEKGDVVCTLPGDQPLYDMGEADRVLLIQTTIPFSFNRTNTGPQSLGFAPSAIDRVLWLGDDQTTIVDGKIPTWAADGTLTWKSGAPPAAVQYTITGRRNPEYFCYLDYPQDRAHHQGRPLPRKVVLRSFELFGRAV